MEPTVPLGLENAPAEYSASLLPTGPSLESKLESARTGLLDLSARNRLLNTPRSGRNKTSLDVVDESSREIYRLLVREERAFTFAPGRASAAAPDADQNKDEITDLAQPDDNSMDERGVLHRHTDTVLQTRMASKGLQKRLLEMYQDSQTFEQEQGVNILFLALGMLKWIDPKNAENIRYAPLVLVPVTLERSTAADRFRLRWRHEDVASNLSLEALLDREHRLRMPVFEAGEEFETVEYYNAVAATVSQKPGWEVLQDDIVLGFFSFAKFLMYRDLDPECWPADSRITTQPLIRALLADGFPATPLSILEGVFIDDMIRPEDMLHVTDADSSQMRAIHESRRGGSFIIQGPPGTGKSQTIANIIAAAVADGKSVLFVAEKMVALSVVKSRLDRAGVGDACLELHSNQANKKTMLQELRRTWELGAPHKEVSPTLYANLEQTRSVLNQHAKALHTIHPVAGRTAFEVAGEVIALLQQDQPPADFDLPFAGTWTSDDASLRQQQVSEFAARIADLGLPAVHPWRGVGPLQLLPTDVARLMQRIDAAHHLLAQVAEEGEELSTLLNLPPFTHFTDIPPMLGLAHRLMTGPALSAAALAEPLWEGTGEQLQRTLQAGRRSQELWHELQFSMQSAARGADLHMEEKLLATLPGDAPFAQLDSVARIGTLLREIEAVAAPVAISLGVPLSATATFEDTRTILAIAEGVLSAPDTSPEAFASVVWQHGLDRAGDLASAAAALDAARKGLGDKFASAATDIDLSSARQILAAHGSGMLRFLSGEWRRADRQVRSLLKDPKAPLSEVLMLLDQYAAARAAIETLRSDADFGRQAFGAMWREERSSASALNAMVAWMQGLGLLRDQVRGLAARPGARHELPQRAAALQRKIAELGEGLQRLPSGVLDAASAPLTELSVRADQIAAALRRLDSLAIRRPEFVEDWTCLLGKLHELQAADSLIRDFHTTALAIFGEIWQGGDSDWQRLENIALWVRDNGDIRAVVASIADRPYMLERVERLSSRAAEFDTAWQELLVSLATSDSILFGFAAPQVDQQLERLQAWLAHPEQLSKWTAYRNSEELARGLQLGPLVDRLQDGRITPEGALRAFSMAYFEALLRELFQAAPALAAFDGDLHSAAVRRFTELDLARISASSIEAVRAHHRRIPLGGGIGPVGVLRGEIAKRSRHLPIRQIMAKAAPAVQALKPVFMMSPLSVAQFLPPGKLHFDLLVMDEASQIQPVDALGAIARCGQVIVVGDERQLPPTRFFAKLTSDLPEVSDEDEESMQVGDIESVLGLFTARGLPQYMLRWHYRSRHESLIALSNSQFYESKLFIIPSPFSQQAGRGLHFHPVDNGVFYSETFASESKFANPIEATAVAEAVLRHALQHPELSLGVATFSVRQRRAILDEVERLRRSNPASEAFFNGHSGEPFFVKNLENVQGDERDVIFISVGYGRDPQGKFAMRFGPLGQDGGERRLNVLISRAKLQCVVFASITDEDLDSERIKSKGVFALKLFMHFARTGRLDLAHTPEIERQRSAVIEAAMQALIARGYTVHPHVGIAGCFVDIGIIHPEVPDRYLLGIEFDSASYKSARSSRDRDRLRREVLESHGWAMHRVWSCDWLHRPKEQLERCVRAVEAARERLREDEASQPDMRPTPLEIVTVERENAVEIGIVVATRTSANLYREATIARPSPAELHETPTGILTACVAEIVAQEGPIHTEEVVTRLRTIWGLHRSGQRIQTAAERAIAQAERDHQILRTGNFLSTAGCIIRPRDRSRVTSLSLRRPEMLPPQEIEAAVLEVVGASFGGTEEEVIQAVARILGYAAKSVQLRHVIADVVTLMVNKRLLDVSGELLVKR